MANEEQTLRDLQDDLVRRAEQLALNLKLKDSEGRDKGKIEDSEKDKDKNREKGKTQVSKALEVLQTAGSLPVFVNWLRYQAGREADQKEKFWTKSAGQRSLAKALADDLGWIQNEVQARLPDLPKAAQNAATIRAATRFLGYFRRAMIGAAYLNDIQIASKEDA